MSKLADLIGEAHLEWLRLTNEVSDIIEVSPALFEDLRMLRGECIGSRYNIACTTVAGADFCFKLLEIETFAGTFTVFAGKELRDWRKHIYESAVDSIGADSMDHLATGRFPYVTHAGLTVKKEQRKAVAPWGFR